MITSHALAILITFAAMVVVPGSLVMFMALNGIIPSPYEKGQPQEVAQDNEAYAKPRSPKKRRQMRVGSFLIISFEKDGLHIQVDFSHAILRGTAYLVSACLILAIVFIRYLYVWVDFIARLIGN